jgi:quercetin 2,3-dioxygenase
MEKQLKSIFQRQFKQNAPGFRSVDIFHGELQIEPFLVFTEFHMDRPIFGPHPHAGVSVMTYMLPDSVGSFLNRDSLGDKSIIEPGGIHVTQAGLGVKHDEVPTINGTDCHGFQIWINHADKDRLVAPKAFHAFSKDVQEYKNDKVQVIIIQGVYQGVQAPFELVTKTTLLHVTLQPGSTISFDAMEMAFVYVLSGKIVSGDHTIGEKSIALFEEPGNKITINTKNEVANFMFASGTPHKEAIVYGGPFVMTTDEQMSDTRKRLARGEMGELLAV